MGVSCHLPFCIHVTGSHCQSSVYFDFVKCAHWECLVNRLFFSMVSWVLIGVVLSIVYWS